MALTKVRQPVADIANISNGTSSIDIASAGADAIVSIAGAVIGTFSSTGLDLNTGLTLVSDVITTESVGLTTVAGASATLETTLTQGRLRTTSAHQLALGANSLDGLTIETDGKVTLGVEGTEVGNLVTKAYVDNAATTLAVQIADVVLTESTNGSITIPSSTGNDLILNWGTTASFSGLQSVTFNTAFPNGFLGAVVSRVTTGDFEAPAHYGSATTTGMTLRQTGGTATPVSYFALGY